MEEIEKNENVEMINEDESLNKTQEVESEGLKETFSKPEKAKKKYSFGKPLLIGLLVICLSCGSGFVGSLFYNNLFGSKKVVLYQSVNNNQSVINTSTNSNDVSSVVSKVSESVVEIMTESVTTNNYYGEYITEGAGSGVIISADGYIVTNNHVVSGANKMTVTLTNGESYEGTLIGTDSSTDLAVIKIDAKDLNPAILGDSDNLVVGQTAIAIGNPLGTLGGTVTEGIISALGREVTINGNKMTLLQTSAAVNPGNSGGGLFNLSGELIGIVNAKSSGSDIEGLGFAIPISNAKTIIEELISNGYVTGRVYLGVSLVDIDSAQTAFQYGVNEQGLYIYSVLEDTAAAEAGLKSGDMIVKIGDLEVDNQVDFKAELLNYTVGDKVALTIKRNGKEQVITVTLRQAK